MCSAATATVRAPSELNFTVEAIFKGPPRYFCRKFQDVYVLRALNLNLLKEDICWRRFFFSTWSVRRVLKRSLKISYYIQNITGASATRGVSSATHLQLRQTSNIFHNYTCWTPPPPTPLIYPSPLHFHHFNFIFKSLIKHRNGNPLLAGALGEGGWALNW